MASRFHGVVYTKKWVVDLILDTAGYVADKPLHSYTICEPSCGCGAFLGSIIDRLASAAKKDEMFFAGGIKDCVRAFDTDAEAVEHSREVVRNRLIANGMEVGQASFLSERWVIESDFILHSDESYDFIVGNPPYLKATEIPAALREEYCKRVSSMTKGCDLFVAFFQRGLEQMKEGGCLTFICADRWLQNQYGRSLRQYLVDNGFSVDVLVRMHGVDAFDSEVDAYPAITKLSRSGGRLSYVDCRPGFDEEDVGGLSNWLMEPCGEIESNRFSAAQMNQASDGSVVPLSSPRTVKKIKRLMADFPSLEQSGIKLGIGLATGNDKVFMTENRHLVERERLLPVFNMRDYRRGVTRDKWLVNPWTTDNQLVDLGDYPLLKGYFMSNKEVLSKRYIAKKGDWYRTIDKPKWDLLKRPMLLFPDLASSSDPVYSPGGKYPCHNCYWMISDVWDIKVLGGLLMSDIAESFVEAQCVKMRGGTLRFQAQYLRLIHVPEFSSIDERTKFSLREAFENRDRLLASRAARVAYGLED